MQYKTILTNAEARTNIIQAVLFASSRMEVFHRRFRFEMKSEWIVNESQ